MRPAAREHPRPSRACPPSRCRDGVHRAGRGAQRFLNADVICPTSGLSDKVLHAVETAGYTEPTPIQAQAIPHVLARRDVLGIAQTGTGKTAAFTLPMLTLLENGRARARMPRTLILEPTRELAAQVVENFDRYGTNHKLNVALIIGGVSFADQDAKLTRGTDVLIATPGRLLDHFERGKLLLTGVELLVIDEADRMLDMGFIPDIERIVKMVPFTRQTLFFSATMPPEIERLADIFLHNPAAVEVAAAGLHGDDHHAAAGRDRSRGHAKRERLRELIRGEGELQERDHLLQPQARRRAAAEVAGQPRLRRRGAARRHGPAGPHHRPRRVPRRRDRRCWWPATSPPAASTSRRSATSSTSTCRTIPRITSTGSAAPAAPDGRAPPTRWSRRSDERSLGAIEALIGQPVPWFDGDLSTMADASADTGTRHRGRSGEAPSRRANGQGHAAGAPGRRGRRRGRGSYQRPAAAAAPRRRSAREARPPAVAARGPSPRIARRGLVLPRVATSTARSGDAARPETDGETPVGLGSHVPAFLLRPVLAKREK